MNKKKMVNVSECDSFFFFEEGLTPSSTGKSMRCMCLSVSNVFYRNILQWRVYEESLEQSNRKNRKKFDFIAQNVRKT